MTLILFQTENVFVVTARSTWTRIYLFSHSRYALRTSVAPAVTVIVAGSPVERRHCPACYCLQQWTHAKSPSSFLLVLKLGLGPTREAQLQLSQSSHILPLLAPRDGITVRAPGRATLFLSADFLSDSQCRKIPLRTLTIVDASSSFSSSFEILGPPFDSFSWFDPFSCHWATSQKTSGKNRFSEDQDTTGRRAHLWQRERDDATTGDNDVMHRRRSATSIARYSGCALTTREEEYGNAARNVSALVLYSPQHALETLTRERVCAHPHAYVYESARASGRLVPPRLRRAPHLLTEYRRIAIWLRYAGCTHGESVTCVVALNPETRRHFRSSWAVDRDSHQLIGDSWSSFSRVDRVIGNWRGIASPRLPTAPSFAWISSFWAKIACAIAISAIW